MNPIWIVTNKAATGQVLMMNYVPGMGSRALAPSERRICWTSRPSRG